jgi:hypothetical protein
MRVKWFRVSVAWIHSSPLVSGAQVRQLPAEPTRRMSGSGDDARRVIVRDGGR